MHPAGVRDLPRPRQGAEVRLSTKTLFSRRVLVFGLCVTFGCAAPSGGTRVIQNTRTRADSKTRFDKNGRPLPAAKLQAPRDPSLAREQEILATLASRKVRALPPTEQSLARAMAMQQ